MSLRVLLELLHRFVYLFYQFMFRFWWYIFVRSSARSKMALYR